MACKSHMLNACLLRRGATSPELRQAVKAAVVAEYGPVSVPYHVSKCHMFIMRACKARPATLLLLQMAHHLPGN